MATALPQTRRDHLQEPRRLNMTLRESRRNKAKEANSRASALTVANGTPMLTSTIRTSPVECTSSAETAECNTTASAATTRITDTTLAASYRESDISGSPADMEMVPKPTEVLINVFRFLDLPRELRDAIIELVLVGDFCSPLNARYCIRKIQRRSSNGFMNSVTRRLAIAVTSRQMEQETLDVLRQRGYGLILDPVRRTRR